MQPKKPPRLMAGVLVVLGAGLVGLGAGLAVFLGWPSAEPIASAAGQTEPESPGPAPVAGAPAPDFSLSGIDGAQVRLSDYRGDVVLVNFWATWCGPCRAEMPLLQERFTALRESGLVVLAVNDDEPVGEVTAFVQELGLTFPILLDPGANVQQLYRVLGYPTSFLVGRDGVIQRVHVGVLTDSQLDRYLREAGFSL
jgi:cytochrome c biogenesis protein CcmG, thiol:disulfide interchange protein DsbE